MPITTAATFCATLVDEWVAAGLRAAMVAPGSRSTPMALALADHPAVRVEIFHDERSAAFAALGHGLATGSPAAVLCSSGTAATHFHAAAVEADLSNVPMLVLTADRPPALVDVGAAQTIDQTHLFGRAVRWFHAPGVPDTSNAHVWRSLARRAYRASVDVRPGPVHLNLAFVEPLVGEPGALPLAQDTAVLRSRPTVGVDELEAILPLLEHQRGVIVAGAGAGDLDADVEGIARLADATGWPVLADPRSRCRELASAVSAADALLRHPRFAADHSPAVVLHVGDPWASRIVNEWLYGSGARHVHLAASPKVVDPGHVMARWVTAPVGDTCRWFAGRLRGATGTTWSARWRHAEATARRIFDECLTASGELSEPAVAHAVVSSLGAPGCASRLVVSSSMPIRDVEWYTVPPAASQVFSNRGANGIDGVIATGIGVALASGPTALLIGDVAFLHDASSLTALSARGADLRIVLVDNNGGGIFSFLPQATGVSPERFELLYGTPHGTDLVALARAHDLRASVAPDRESLLAALAEPGPSVTVVHSDRQRNVQVHRDLHDAVHAALG
jgi:2-succinyl-5-enolpyruvyl-6-hydroxy-3-cyclohexene-1-carboxylate synthase